MVNKLNWWWWASATAKQKKKTTAKYNPAYGFFIQTFCGCHEFDGGKQREKKPNRKDKKFIFMMIEKLRTVYTVSHLYA